MSFDKLSSEEICLILLLNKVNKPTSNIYFEKLFENINFDWSKTYLSPRLAIIHTIWCSFQYKIFNKVLFLNKKLYPFGITNNALSPFCHPLEELLHIFFWVNSY